MGFPSAPIFSSNGTAQHPSSPPVTSCSSRSPEHHQNSCEIGATANIFPPISVSSTCAASSTLTEPRLTFPLLPQCCRRSPPPPWVIEGHHHHRSAAAPPVFATSPMTHHYGEPPPSYSCPTRHAIDAHSRAARVGEPPHLSHRRPPCHHVSAARMLCCAN
jgi:hypothetical protein